MLNQGCDGEKCWDPCCASRKCGGDQCEEEFNEVSDERANDDDGKIRGDIPEALLCRNGWAYTA